MPRLRDSARNHGLVADRIIQGLPLNVDESIYYSQHKKEIDLMVKLGRESKDPPPEGSKGKKS